MDCRETQTLLTAFHDGELPADGQGGPSAGAGRDAPGSVAPAVDRARVEEHLRGCPECTALLAGLARVDRAAGVPDPGPAYWDRFNARVMERVTQADEGQGWPSVGAGRDVPGFEAPTGPKVAVLRPKGGWVRQQLRYLVPAAAAAALVVMVVHYGGMHPVVPTTARDGQVPGQAGTPPVLPSRPAMDGQVPRQAGTPRVLEPRPPVPDKERFAAVTREERDRLADRPLPAGIMEAPRDRATAPAAIGPSPPPVAERHSAGVAESASGRNMAKDSSAEAPAEASLGKTRSKAGPSTLASASRPADGQGRPSAGAGRDAPGSVAPADGQGRPSAGVGKDAPGSVAPASPCERARALAERERVREAEGAQRACLAGDLDAPSREKGLVFLAELLDRQTRFADADAVIAEVDRRYPQSRPLDLYRQQRPMVQKQSVTAPGTR